MILLDTIYPTTEGETEYNVMNANLKTQSHYHCQVSYRRSRFFPLTSVNVFININAKFYECLTFEYQVVIIELNTKIQKHFWTYQNVIKMNQYFLSELRKKILIKTQTHNRMKFSTI